MEERERLNTPIQVAAAAAQGKDARDRAAEYDALLRKGVPAANAAAAVYPPTPTSDPGLDPRTAIAWVTSLLAVLKRDNPTAYQLTIQKELLRDDEVARCIDALKELSDSIAHVGCAHNSHSGTTLAGTVIVDTPMSPEALMVNGTVIHHPMRRDRASLTGLTTRSWLRADDARAKHYHCDIGFPPGFDIAKYTRLLPDILTGSEHYDERRGAKGLPQLVSKEWVQGARLVTITRVHEGDRDVLVRYTVRGRWDDRVDLTVSVDAATGKLITGWFNHVDDWHRLTEARETYTDPGAEEDAANDEVTAAYAYHIKHCPAEGPCPHRREAR